ncbi:allantoate amidohydrolase [Nocardioides sp.]|uniref:allantoate amidohydrolase n=1 Tax=Nocardioides sp. TaxID=35761 RepID=UPI0039E6C928
MTSLLTEIDAVGADRVRGGYSRPVLSEAELDLRSWFIEHARRRGLDVEVDANQIIWAWAGPPVDGALVTGSHLDSVPGGGAYDGPLGIASALVAFDRLAERDVPGSRAIAVFPEEEGSRFGVACLGSRLLTGAIAPERALALTDPAGLSLAEAMRAGGLDPRRMGADPTRLARIGTFLELHVEQGRGLVDLDRPVAVASSVLGHGRWRITILGRGDHAGTTLMSDRSDPMVAAARTVVQVQALARDVPDARATVGRLSPTPGGTNVIASRIDLWVDVRHPDDGVTRALVESIRTSASAAADAEGCTATMTEESFSGTVGFDPGLREELAEVLDRAPVLRTGAGHDAGVLAGHVPTAMLFVRNPTGVSHAPGEHVEPEDAEQGAVALTEAMTFLLQRGDGADG